MKVKRIRRITTCHAYIGPQKANVKVLSNVRGRHFCLRGNREGAGEAGRLTRPLCKSDPREGERDKKETECAPGPTVQGNKGLELRSEVTSREILSLLGKGQPYGPAALGHCWGLALGRCSRWATAAARPLVNRASCTETSEAVPVATAGLAEARCNARASGLRESARSAS